MVLLSVSNIAVVRFCNCLLLFVGKLTYLSISNFESVEN